MAYVQHGMCYTPEYKAYNAAKTRCNNPNYAGWGKWGGRGIEFRFTSFAEFLAAIGPKPTKFHSVDRIDNNGHYERGNVRWATPIEQANNQRPHKRPGSLCTTPGCNIYAQTGGICGRCSRCNIHYQVNGGPVCGCVFKRIRLTTSAPNVTCDRCREKLLRGA